MYKTKSVIDYINKNHKWRGSLVLLKDLIESTELTENIKWGSPVYTIENKNIVGIAAFKNYVGLWFHQGALLKDKSKKLINAQANKTKALRQWRFSSKQEVINQSTHILTYIDEAIKNHKLGKTIKPVRKTALELPPELIEKLDNNRKLTLAFDKFTASKQGDFIEYINDAKQQTTKLKRLNKIIPMIEIGEGLNDKYRK